MTHNPEKTRNMELVSHGKWPDFKAIFRLKSDDFIVIFISFGSPNLVVLPLTYEHFWVQNQLKFRDNHPKVPKLLGFS